MKTWHSIRYETLESAGAVSIRTHCWSFDVKHTKERYPKDGPHNFPAMADSGKEPNKHYIMTSRRKGLMSARPSTQYGRAAISGMHGSSAWPHDCCMEFWPRSPISPFMCPRQKAASAENAHHLM